MDYERERIVKEIVTAIRKISRSIYLDSRKMIKQFGLTGPQSHVMRVLASNEPLSSAALSRLLFVTPANMTGIIDRLENKELITRNKKIGDRRISLIGLTEKGKELGQSLPDPTEEKLILGLADLEPTEIYGIYSAVEKILDLVDAKDLSDVPLDPSIITIPVSDFEE